MNEEIEKLIEAGQAKINAENKLMADQARNLKMYRAEQATLIERLALDLIPEALRPFAYVDADDDYLRIAHPDMAHIACKLAVFHGGGRYADDLGHHVFVADVERVNLRLVTHGDGGWRISTWIAQKDDDCHWDAYLWRTEHEPTDDLERALAIAAELGNNHVTVDEEVEFFNEQVKLEREMAAADSEKKGIWTWISKSFRRS